MLSIFPKALNIPRFARAGSLRLCLILTTLVGSLTSPASWAATDEPVATFSIVGCDPERGEVGVAVQSKFFAVGAVVPWARAGVGAVATQSFANTTFGPRGLQLLTEGLSVHEVLDVLLATDNGRERRQIGIVDTEGNAAAFTGSGCLAWAGQESGRNFTAQGNILVGQETVSQMARAFRETEGMLGEKLMRALEAGQEAGGDSRGQQSAAILIVKEGSGYGGFNDRYCDLRVDDHATPIVELRRIFDMWKINALVLEGYRLLDQGDFDAAAAAGENAVRLDPKSGESHYHLACFLSRGGNAQGALEVLGQALDRDPRLGPRARDDPDFKPLADHPRFQELVGVEK